MDEKPFLEINMLNIKGSQVSELAKFQKPNFNVEAIVDTASELKYTNEIQALFAQELQEPSDELLRFFLNSVYSGVKTQSVMERFRPILKKALNDYISELMNDKIKNALNVDAPQPELSKLPEAPEEPEEEDKKSGHEDKIVTTAEELGAYFIVKMILKDAIPTQEITYKDTVNYIGILYQNKVTKWICRLILNGSRKILIIPDENKKEMRYTLESVYDIESYKDQLIEVAKRYI